MRRPAPPRPALARTAPFLAAVAATTLLLTACGTEGTGAGDDKQPRRVTLGPGESATAGLVWRNTTEPGTPVNVPHVRVRAKAGADPVTVTPGLDLGTTGKLGVRPWVKAER
ncbi:hypothetical protein EES45_31780 [Streptomyces sp. ADI97-07]|nr:hypothetical protein EES45_31780 [Streptomyces sp. ADI97-07]